MTAWAQLRSWTSSLLGRTRMEREMDEEMRFHIEARAADLMKQGVPTAQAACTPLAEREKWDTHALHT